MDKYYVCRDDGDQFIKITTKDNYFDAVIKAVVHAKKHSWTVVVIHGNDIVHRAKP